MGEEILWNNFGSLVNIIFLFLPPLSSNKIFKNLIIPCHHPRKKGNFRRPATLDIEIFYTRKFSWLKISQLNLATKYIQFVERKLSELDALNHYFAPFSLRNTIIEIGTCLFSKNLCLLGNLLSRFYSFLKNKRK